VPPRKTDDRLVRKGRDVPPTSLTQQARVSIQLARAHAVGLARYGWSPPQTEALLVRTQALAAVTGERCAHADAARRATLQEAVARREAMRFLRHLRTALPLALRAAPSDGPAARAFLAGAPLGRCSAKVLAHLVAIASPVAHLEAQLAPYFPGARPTARLAHVHDALGVAQAERTRLHAEIPTQSDRAHRVAGELLEAIEDLHRIAKLAFEDEPLLRAAFSKKWIERGHRRRPVAEATPIPGAAA
jgi:hypothetical protein